MAITQISQITQRKGLQIDLPRLAGAEFGWSTDSRRLFIGNGTIEEGAPVVGNTEILTEFSDIVNISEVYTYKGANTGYIAQTGPTIDSPVTLTLQQWMDQWVSVLDFGATGDGVTDDTDAINRALYQVYCRASNPQTRKALYFPAGVYRTTSSLLVPPYATLYGEGSDNSIILLSGNPISTFVARTTDSDQHYGSQIGSNSATLPTNVTFINMAFATTDPESELLLLEDVLEVKVESVGFFGPLLRTEITSADPDMSAIRFKSKAGRTTSSISFNQCQFANLTYALNSNDWETGDPVAVKGVTLNACSYVDLYQGIVLGKPLGQLAPSTGFRVTNSFFNGTYVQAIYFGQVALNVSSNNIFYNCGSYLLGDDNPYTAIIEFAHGDNVSVGDMFARDDEHSGINDPGTGFQRINLNLQPSIAFDNGSSINVGTYIRKSGNTAILESDAPVSLPVIDRNGVPVTVNAVLSPIFSIDYQIVRGPTFRNGTLTVTASSNDLPPTWSDDYTENEGSGIDFTFELVGEDTALFYTSYNTGQDSSMSFSVRTFDFYSF